MISRLGAREVADRGGFRDLNQGACPLFPFLSFPPSIALTSAQNFKSSTSGSD